MSEPVTEAAAARAWAVAYNTCSPAAVEALLAEDVRYASQWVFDEIEGRAAYLDYLEGKLATISRTATVVVAELAETRPYPMAPNPPRPCVVVSQDGELKSTVLFQVADRGIVRIDMCAVPPPETCARSGEAPTA